MTASASSKIGRRLRLSAGGAADSGFGGRILGSGNLRKTGSGTLQLSGVSAYSGSTQVAQGTLRLTGNERLPDTTALTVDAGATLRADNSETVAQATIAGTLQGPVVGTVMSNLGLEQKLKSEGVEFLRNEIFSVVAFVGTIVLTQYICHGQSAQGSQQAGIENEQFEKILLRMCSEGEVATVDDRMPENQPGSL
jgi:autotransporter-associated beta strand protein